MSMYGKNHYNIVISLQLIQINEKKKERIRSIISKRKKKCSILLFSPAHYPQIVG